MDTGGEANKRKFTEEHRAKIKAALKAYHATERSHLPSIRESGEAHPNWKGGINAKVYRKKAFEAYGNTCQECGGRDHIEVHHKDGNRHNSNIENLKVLCRACHIRQEGRTRGEKNGQAKLTAVKVAEIRAKWATGQYYQKALAGEYGVSVTLIGNIVNNKVWRGKE